MEASIKTTATDLTAINITKAQEIIMISGLLTTSTGELYASHFQNGGTLEDLTLDSIVEYVKGTFNSDKLSLKNISASAFNGILSKYNIA